MTHEAPTDVTTGHGVELVYEMLRVFNRSFHGEELAPFPQADEQEQAAATSSYIWVRDHPEMAPSEIHATWLAEMQKQGWSGGERYSEDDKTHPHMREWSDLPPWARRMLFLTSTAVHILSAPIEQVDETLAEGDADD